MIEDLKIQVESFSELQENWDSYGADEVSVPSIMTAHRVLDTLPKFINVNTISVFPMRDGGVQIDIGEQKEIEVNGYDVKEINYDSNFNIINTYHYNLSHDIALNTNPIYT
jgi:hypothetical protein